MSPTLLEFAVAIILLVVAWQIGVIVAPGVLRWLRELKNDVDGAAAAGFDEQNTSHEEYNKEHRNGTRH
jgi:hypothetical protein